MRTKTEYSPQQKADVLSRIATGLPLKTAAREAGIPANTVRGWAEKVALPTGGRPDATIPTFRELLNTQVQGLILDNLAGLRALALQATNIAWREKQSASELARLGAQQSNDLIRLLSTLADEDPGGRDPREPGEADGPAVALPGPAERSPEADS